jgi:hypothetical protein
MQHVALASKPFNTSATKKKKFQKDLEASDSPQGDIREEAC